MEYKYERSANESDSVNGNCFCKGFSLLNNWVKLLFLWVRISKNEPEHVITSMTWNI